MNRQAILSLTIAAATLGAAASDPIVSDAALDVKNRRMTATMVLKPAALNLGRNQSALLTPAVVTAAGDTLALAPVAIFGRNRAIHAERSGEKTPALTFTGNNVPATLDYSDAVAWSEVLDGARLGLRIEEYGCANCLKDRRWIDLAQWQMPRFNPADAVVYEVPQATAVKETSLSGRAFVEFPVNKTTLLTDFRTNAAELAKITATIDSVKSDPDITLTSISIKGFASPEGKYDNNRRLAAGRTDALRLWVERLYSFPAGFIATAYEPEDWDGLRAAVEADATLPYRAGLLEIINDNSLEPDARDARLRSAYPEAYARLLNEIYPSLRHSDYRVDYTIRSFTSPEEILAVMEQNPAKLSADEFFVAAQSLNPDSELFGRVLRTAAETHPDNTAANLNAASAALRIHDLESAERYLSRAGNSPEAMYSRGLLAMERRDYGSAEIMLSQAAKAGYTKAADLLPIIQQLKQL